MGSRAERQRQLAWVNHFKMIYGCCRCGERDPRCLDLHHKDPATKIAEVSAKIGCWSDPLLWQEIRKCEILCANCHHKLHAEEITARAEENAARTLVEIAAWEENKRYYRRGGVTFEVANGPVNEAELEYLRTCVAKGPLFNGQGQLPRLPGPSLTERLGPDHPFVVMLKRDTDPKGPVNP